MSHSKFHWCTFCTLCSVRWIRSNAPRMLLSCDFYLSIFSSSQKYLLFWIRLFFVLFCLVLLKRSTLFEIKNFFIYSFGLFNILVFEFAICNPLKGRKTFLLYFFVVFFFSNCSLFDSPWAHRFAMICFAYLFVCLLSILLQYFSRQNKWGNNESSESMEQ